MFVKCVEREAVTQQGVWEKSVRIELIIPPNDLPNMFIYLDTSLQKMNSTIEPVQNGWDRWVDNGSTQVIFWVGKGQVGLTVDTKHSKSDSLII